jgi:hypothetical protein
MIRLLSLFIILLSSMLFLSCGYTVLQKSRSSDAIVAPLPDLIINGMSYRNDTSIYADDTDTTTSFIFTVKVVNIGKGPFQGPCILAWADNPENIGWGKFENSEQVGFPNNQLASSDSATIEVSIRHRAYVSGRLIRFVLVTQSVMPGNFCHTFFSMQPVAETRYDNNVYDYNFP